MAEPGGQVAHQMICAAMTNGCRSVLRWWSDHTEIDEPILLLNGWWKDHGKWVCGNHEPRRKEPSDG